MPGNIQNHDDIKQSIAALRETADMLQLVLDGGATLTNVAERINRTPQRVNTMLRKHFQPYIRSRILTIENLATRLNQIKTPADRLVELIFETEDESNKNKLIILPEYDEDLVWDIAYETLSQREYDIISGMCGTTGEIKQMTQIAEEQHVTRMRIMQLKNKAIRKLRKYNVIHKMFPALTCYALDITKVVEENLNHAVAVWHTVQTTEIPDEPKSTGISIESIAMTSRTYHALHRHGIETLDQLVPMPAREIMAIRNLGAKSMVEINDLLETHFGIRKHLL